MSAARRDLVVADIAAAVTVLPLAAHDATPAAVVDFVDDAIRRGLSFAEAKESLTRDFERHFIGELLARNDGDLDRSRATRASVAGT